MESDPSMPSESQHIEPSDLRRLSRAVTLLEKSSLATMLAQALGRPVTAILGSLPNIANVAIQKAAQKSIQMCLRIAVRPTSPNSLLTLAGRYPRLISGITGAIGGFAGLPGVAIELPVTTLVMFQSIAGIAAEEGEDLSNPDARLACLEVFALGTSGKSVAKSESVYYAARNSLAQSLEEASNYVLRRGTAQQTAPLLVQFASAIAARFGLLVSEELAAAAIPVVGAVSGAALNVVFMQHFNNIAHGHFAVRALERKYGETTIREQFDLLRMQIESRRSGPAAHRTLSETGRSHSKS
jgi:hypothetical protein